MNLIIAPSTDLFTTAAPPGALVARPPGDGWSLAGLEVSRGSVVVVVYFWTRSKVYAESEAKAQAAKAQAEAQEEEARKNPHGVRIVPFAAVPQLPVEGAAP